MRERQGFHIFVNLGQKLAAAVGSALQAGVELRPHQEDAVQKAVRQNGNLILSHPVGSGKTVTAIAAFDRLRQNGMADRALIVTPASLRKNFTNEGVHKFTKDKAAVFGNAEEVANGTGRHVDDPDPSARYHVVSYDLFRTNPEKYIKSSGADTVIYDELHKIKNIGITGKALREARKHHRNFIGLTGSIVSNTPADLVPLVDAMTDGQHHLGTKENFERRFMTEDGKLQNTPVVRLLLNPYIHHVDASTGGGAMPKKTVETVKVDMTPEQQELYQYVVGKMDPVTALKFRFGSSKLKTNDINNIFNKMTQARQVSNAIHTVNKSVTLAESAQRSPKIKRVLDDVETHLKETPDGQVIIYSNMIQGGVDVLSQGLKDRGIAHGIFMGKGQAGSTEQSRSQAVADYQAGTKKVILLSSAGGEGLNLGNTTFVANVDGHFNPEKIHQAEARGVRAGGQAHRPEDQRHVLIRRYVTRVPLSKTQVAKDTMNLIAPSGMLSRVLEGQPVFYNPLKRERSPDEWAYEVAWNKDERNKQLRGNLDKTAEAPCDTVEDMLDLLEDGLAARAGGGATKMAGSRLRAMTRVVSEVSSVHPDRTHWTLLVGGKPAGRMVTRDGQIMGTEIEKEFRNLGLGRKFYGEVARRMPGASLKSDGQVSPEATRLWNSLGKGGHGWKVEQAPWSHQYEHNGMLRTSQRMPWEGLTPEIKAQMLREERPWSYRGSLPEAAAIKTAADQKTKERRLAAQRLPMQPYRLVKSDRPIMEAYMKEFAPHLEEAVDPTKVVLPKELQEREQEYVEALRAYYREAAKPGSGDGLVSKAKTDDERKREILKQTLAVGALGALITGYTQVVTAAVQSLKSGLPMKDALPRAAAIGLLGGGVLGGMNAWSSYKDPKFSTTGARARRSARLTDEQMIHLLRGLEVQQEEKKLHRLAVGSNARAVSVK